MSGPRLESRPYQGLSTGRQRNDREIRNTIVGSPDGEDERSGGHVVRRATALPAVRGSAAERPPRRSLVDVLAAGLHPRVRTGAAGAHYTSTGTLPMIPGIDAVGRRADGKRIYFVADDDVTGTMADKAVVDVRRAVELPDDVDVAKVAAAMNPAMSSWVALRRRVPIEAGPERPRARRDRERRNDGRTGRQTARCGTCGRRRT